MEDAARSIETLAAQILPQQPYYLSISATCTYRIRPGEKRLDEQDVRPLQYSTLVGGEADRGVLLTRAYFSVREEPNANNAPAPPTLILDPNKPRKKMTLKDYKSKKTEGDSPPKLEKEKPNGLPTIKEKEEINKRTGSAPGKETDSRHDSTKVVGIAKVEPTRHQSPSPERKKRVAEADENARPLKRAKVGDAIPNSTTPRPPKDAGSQKPVKNMASGKNEVKDTKPPPTTNGKPITSGPAPRAASPKHAMQVNGHAKTNSVQSTSTHKKATSNHESAPKTVPKLLSPLDIAELSIEKSSDTLKEGVSEPRPSPRKKPTETNILKQTKKSREDREPSPSVRKRKVLPPLLSPTLPPLVMEELAKLEKSKATPSKDANLRNSQSSDSSIARKPTKSPMRQDTVLAVSKKEAPPQFMVTMKYKKRHAKTIERLLNLPSGGKKRMENLKKEDQTPHESSGATELNTARKRPQTTTDTSEASKRPKSSDPPRPLTPSKQSTSMSRIASNSSQVETPGAANSLTPSAQFSGKRREPIAPDKLQRAQRLHSGHKYFMELGTKLKHERDAIMKGKTSTIQEREHQIAVAAGIQSLLLYMHAVKLQSDAFDLERLPRRPQSWREVLPLFPVIRSDCSRNTPLSALLLRLQGICMNYMGRAFWFLPNDSDAAEKALSISKDEADIWRQAEIARRKLGMYDGTSGSSDGGVVGKLIDRLGPWTTPDEMVPVALEVMRNIIRIDGPWKPIDELAKIARGAVKAMSA
ncbi:hypothetical protein GGR50DRAFT_368645 [Xylaria sp. CBS 124048]|nr:hypothetical protein GGR50DRAFT_368645 [Xylaria sp. CBS 124048]